MLNQNLLLAGDDAYNLTRSLRFRSSVSAYLNRTFATGNRLLFTFSAWVKRGSLTGNQNIFGPDTSTSGSGTYGVLRFVDGNLEAFDYTNGTSNWYLSTTPVYRDPSAWYHIVMAYDSAQATSSNRVKLYVNGVQITSFGTANYPTSSYQGQWNNNLTHYLGTAQIGSSNQYFDGYMTEVNFIDGQALTPSSFGETDAATGVWKPKKFSGTYGTNGFYLKFTDNSSLSALGTDSSGNGNTWTVNNFSVTSTSSAYDSMKDVPTLTDTDTANYCTLNPLDNRGGNTTSDGNLKLGPTTGSSWKIQPATLAVSSGKWYFEAGQSAAANSNLFACGVVPVPTPINSYTNLPSSVASAEGWSFQLDTTSTLYFWYGYSGSAQYVTISTSFGTSDVAQIAVDIDSGKIWVGKNNTWYDSSGGTTGNPATGANPTASNISGTIVPFLGSYGTTAAGFANFGQRPFAYTPPTGFVALNTFNLPTPTIGATASTQANKYFNAITYTGNGAASSNTTQNITTSFYPDFTWVKGRDSAFYHRLTSTGLTQPNYLSSNSTDAEGSVNDTISALASTYFQVKAAGTGGTNQSGSTYVGWVWNANSGSTVSNTAGSITSTVSANTTAGFSIVTYTGNATSGATVGHGLGVAPSMVIVKSRSAANNWCVYHISMGNQYATLLNTTAGSYSNSNYWNNTSPTSTLFSLGNGNDTNQSSATFVAYCFAQVAGYSAFGSYTGNGSTDGPFIFTGFRPRYVLIKNSSTGGYSWAVYDSARDLYNIEQSVLFPDQSIAESVSSTYATDFLSNGFKLRTTNPTWNASGNTYIYMAFAESPFKYSLAR